MSAPAMVGGIEKQKINNFLLTFDKKRSMIAPNPAKGEFPVEHKSRAPILTLWANRILMLVILILAFAMPGLLHWYDGIRQLGNQVYLAILIAFYLCVPIALFALGNLERLLGNITSGQVFIRYNVLLIRRVCYCCMLVSLICIPAAVYYPPLIFFSIVMLFLCPVVGVVRSVFDAAVTIREENDLTI